MFVRVKHHCTLICFPSFQNFHVHPNDTIRHFVEFECWDLLQQHRHYKMYPKHLFHRNLIFQTVIVKGLVNLTLNFFMNINHTCMCCRLAFTEEHACFNSSKAHFRCDKFSGWCVSITQATSSRGRLVGIVVFPDMSLRLDILSVCRTLFTSEIKKQNWGL